MRNLKIRRSEWLHGEGSSRSKLYRTSDGKKCCLGIYLEACGLPLMDMANLSVPSQVAPLPVEAAWLLGDAISQHPSATIDSNVSLNLTYANDDQRLSEPSREQRITELFRNHDVEVTFID
jgi:hypothetical protein